MRSLEGGLSGVYGWSASCSCAGMKMSRSVVRILPCVIAITMTPSVSGQCQLQQLVPGNRVAGDQYGDAVAVDGDWAVVGASRDDEPLSNSGSATIFEFDGLAWIEHSKITAADLESNDLFGWSVDLDADAPGGPLILVGAYLDDDPGNAGSAYLFRYDGNAWNQEAKLVASDASGGEEFGQSVALSGNVAVIGAAREDDGGTDRGAAYVYRRSGASWNEEAKLTPAARVDFDRFGIAVDVDATNPLAERIIVGASLHDPSGVVNAGGAWVFHSDGTTWQEYVLTAPDPMENDKFGEAVAIVGDTAVVGAFLDDDAASNAGSVFVFAWDGSSWTNDPPVILTALDAGADDQFGKAIDITPDGLSIVVGAALDDDMGSASGAAYVYTLVDGAFWIEQAKLVSDTGAANDEFGGAVAIAPAVGEGNFILAGASKADEDGASSGAAYLFTDTSDECADCNQNLVPDAAEIIDDPLLDCNNNGIIDACEISEDSVAAGGPYYCTADCDPDCNDNGIPDVCDITDGTSPDDDFNGVPDECEDCNNNAVPDSLDILKGTSQDCNDNGIPDDCEISDGTAEDCNGNGIPDACDLDVLDPDGDGLVSEDCNGDGVPDECDDCNGNGIADDCDIDPLDPDGDGEVSLDGNSNGVPDECEDCNQNGFPDYFELDVIAGIDCNGNGIIDDCEIAESSGAPGGPFFCTSDCDPDCNGNGIPDSCDIADGTSDDEDGTGVPDECEDCNENGTPDSIDILTNGSNDCNQNGLPDECEISFTSQAPGGPFYCTTGCAADCNQNGIPDDCDAAAGLDCNEDGVPDECEPDCDGNGTADACDIADGTVLDINDNGIPDTCEPDCDGDGFPDFAEILFGQAEDCNENGIPDSCDLDPLDPDGNGFVSSDVNGDGIPDECSTDGDVNGDGTVDFDDLLVLLGSWGACPLPPTQCPADLDTNSVVDFNDLLILLTNWS